MKVLLVRGNPRKTGVCERLADIFVDGLIAGGADVFDFDTTTAKISHCKGCLTCNFGEVGRCVIGDDMLEVCDYLSSADALICVSPVYFYTMSSQMKMFFDRCFPFVRGYSYNADLQRNENHLSFKNSKRLNDLILKMREQNPDLAILVISHCCAINFVDNALRYNYDEKQMNKMGFSSYDCFDRI